MELELVKFELISSPEVLYRKVYSCVATFKGPMGNFDINFYCTKEHTAVGDKLDIGIGNIDYPLLPIRQKLKKWAEETL